METMNSFSIWRRRPTRVSRRRGPPQFFAVRYDIAVAAEMPGMSSRAGEIRAGLEADLLVVERNPLEDIEILDDPLVVISNGRVVVDRLSFALKSDANQTSALK